MTENKPAWTPKPPGASNSAVDPWGHVGDWNELLELAAQAGDVDDDLMALLVEEERLAGMSKEEREAVEYWRLSPNRLQPIDWTSEPPTIDWLVPDRLHRSGLAQIYGPPYSGKTLFALDLALSTAAGLDRWMDYTLRIDGPQHVLYVANEGGAPFRVQVHAWLLAHPEVDPQVITEHFWLLDGGEGDVLELPHGTGRDAYDPAYADSLRRLIREIGARGFIPALVVYDTQVDLAPGINENDNAAMVSLLRTIKADADKAGHLAVVVHHSGHAGGHARGASGQRAKADVQVQVQPVGTGNEKRALWSESKIKGAAMPDKDDAFESYRVEGSEGATIRRIGPVQMAVAQRLASRPSDDDQQKVLDAIRDGHTSATSMEAVTGLSRRGKLKDILRWLQDEGVIYNSGTQTKPAFLISQLLD